MITQAQICEAAEHAFRLLGIEDDDAEAALALALEISLPSKHQLVPGLSPKESRVARLISAASPRTVSKGQIFEALYADNEDVDMKIIDVWISKIRKASPEFREAIRTTWGRGYQWIGPSVDEIIARDTA